MKLKKVTALALSAVMAFSAFGCGSEKKSTTKMKKVDVASATSLENSVVLLPDYKTGEFTMTADVKVIKDGQKRDMFLSATGERAGDDLRTGVYLKLGAKGQNIDMNMLNLISVTGGKAYINIDSILTSIGAKDSKAGYYAIPAPEFDSKKKDEFEKEAEELSKQLITAMLEGADVTGSEGDFTAKINSAEGYIKSLKAVVKFADENKEKIASLFEKSGDLIDYEKYIDKLVDSVGDDLVDASDVLGLKISKDQINSLKSSLKQGVGKSDSGSLGGIVKSIDELKAALENTSEEDMKKSYESFKDAAFTITVKADEKNYNVNAVMNLAANDGSSLSLDVTYKFVGKDTKISKPGNTKSLKEIAEYLKENPTLFMNLMSQAYSLK